MGEVEEKWGWWADRWTREQEEEEEGTREEVASDREGRRIKERGCGWGRRWWGGWNVVVLEARRQLQRLRRSSAEYLALILSAATARNEILAGAAEGSWQRGRLTGSQGRHRANWICRRLTNSGEAPSFLTLFYSSFQPSSNISFQPNRPRLPLRPSVCNHNKLTAATQKLFSTFHSRQSVFVYLAQPLCVCVCVRDSRWTRLGHLLILIKYHLTRLTSKSHHTWPDQAGFVLLCCSPLKLWV